VRSGALLPVVLCVAAAVAAVVGCAQEQYPADLYAWQHPTPDASTAPPLDAGASESSAPSADGQVASGPAVCLQTHAESLPARVVAMSTTAPSGGNIMLVSDLFQRFNEVTVCFSRYQWIRGDRVSDVAD